MFKRFLPALFLFLILTSTTFVFYLSDINKYGPTWDELIFHRETGKRYYNFLKTKDLAPIMNYGESSWFPPIAPTLGHFFVESSYIEKFFPDANDRFHIAGIIFGSLTVGIVFLISFILTGSYLSGIFASVLLAFQTQFITFSHNNIRDAGLAFFYSITILSFLITAYTGKYTAGFLICGFLTGLATATKQNGAFLVFIGTVYFLNLRSTGFIKKTAGIIYYIFIAIWTFILFWPYFWVNTINHFQQAWHFLTDPKIIAGNTVFFDKEYSSMKSIPVFYPFIMLFLLHTPLLSLTAFSGLLKTFIDFLKGKKSGIIFLWIFLPLARFFIKTSSISYDQIRHFFEVVPAIPVLAVLFVHFLVKRISFKSLAVKKAAYIAGTGWLLITTFYNIYLVFIYRPYGTAYFNMLAGPPDYVNHAFDVEYYGNVYRAAAGYLRSNYPKTVRYYTAGLGAHILVQNGLQNPMTDDIGNDFEYVIFMNKQAWLRSNSYAMWLLKNKKPIFTIERGGKILFYQFLPYKDEYLKAGG